MGGKQSKHAHMYHLRSFQGWRGIYGAFVVRIPGLFSAISKKTTHLTPAREGERLSEALGSHPIACGVDPFETICCGKGRSGSPRRLLPFF
jgi:hypothetical protein